MESFFPSSNPSSSRASSSMITGSSFNQLLSRGGSTDLIKLHCDEHPDRLVDRFCLSRGEFICGKCPLTGDNTRRIDKVVMSECMQKVNELLRERMLEIVQTNQQPTQQLKHILTLQNTLIKMVAEIGGPQSVGSRVLASQFGKIVEHIQPMLKSEADKIAIFFCTPPEPK